MNQIKKQLLLVCVCVFALNGQAIASELSDATAAYKAGNFSKAASLFIPLAKRGEAQAQGFLAAMYDKGQGVSQDYEAAAKWYRLAAEQGNASAQSSLAFMYSKGQVVPLDYKEALKWYRLAAEQGNADAQLRLGDWFSFWGANVFTRQSVSQDNLEIPKDYNDLKAAVKWYQLAAEQGNADAQLRLGDWYADEKSKSKDYAEAVKWYRLAAENGNVDAQVKLVGWYADGKVVTQNPVVAYMWANIAALNAEPREFQKIVNYRDSIAIKMNAQQIAEAQKLSKKCLANKSKGC